MKDLSRWDLTFFFIGILFTGFSVGGAFVREDFGKQAIAHGAAHYDSVTGKWEWNK